MTSQNYFSADYINSILDQIDSNDPDESRIQTNNGRSSVIMEDISINKDIKYDAVTRDKKSKHKKFPNMQIKHIKGG